jgi:hypothetical protein
MLIENASTTDQLRLQHNGTAAIVNAQTGPLRLQQGGTTYMSVDTTGFVGINVFTPSEALDVNGEARIRTINNATGDFLTANAAGNIRRRTASEVLGDIGAQAALTNPVTGTGTSGQVSFWNGTTTQTGDNDLFWDNTNKRLGIGTTTPIAKLHTQATSITSGIEEVQRWSVSDAANQYLSLTNATATDGNFIPTLRGINTTNNNIGFFLSNQSTIDTGTNPITVFDSRLPSGPVAVRPLFQWRSFTNNYMTMLANGNLGIGTTTPDAKLNIIGNLIVNGDTNRVISSNQATPTLGVLSPNINLGGSYGLSFGVSNTGNSWIQSQRFDANTAVYNILLNPSGGNVGIGTTSPIAKLHIDGDYRMLFGTTVPTFTTGYDYKSYKEYSTTSPSQPLTITDANILDISPTSTYSGIGVAQLNTTVVTSNLNNFTNNNPLRANINVVSVNSSTGEVNAIAVSTNTFQNTISGGIVEEARMYTATMDPGVTHNGTTNKLFGFYMSDQSSITGVPSSSNRFGVYIADNGKNYFAGDVGIGTTSFNDKLTVNGATKTQIVKVDTDSSTTDAILTIDATLYQMFRWTANFTTNRTLNISNLNEGMSITIFIANTNGTARNISIQASTTTTSHVEVELSDGSGGFVNNPSVGATTGRRTITVARVGGQFVGMAH